MTAAGNRLRAQFGVLRARRPGAAGRIEDAALAARGRGALVAEVRMLRARLRELERDHLLLAAHVATLTERGASAGAPDTDGEAARERARLAGIAFYEERISRLEQREAVQHPRRRSEGRGRRVSIGRTSGEPDGTAS